MPSTKKIQLPLRKLFTKEQEAQLLFSTSEPNEIPLGTYCVWRPKASVEKSSSPKNCKQSNSIGWSKLWKLRDLIHLNNSEGSSYSTIIHQKKSLIFQNLQNFALS
nr:uncharacterized protein LOC109150784 [Ipomoea trifida]